MYERYILKKLRFEHGKETEQKKKKRKVSLLFAPKLQPVLTTAGWDDHLDADLENDDEDENEIIIMDEEKDDTSSNNGDGGDGGGEYDNHHTGNDDAGAN